MDKLKVIIEEPSGSRRSFFYNVKSEEEAKDIAEGKPTVAAWKHVANQLKDHPRQKCDKIEQCIEQVRAGSSVYILVC